MLECCRCVSKKKKKTPTQVIDLIRFNKHISFYYMIKTKQLTSKSTELKEN